jgi:hypothetical protein
MATQTSSELLFEEFLGLNGIPFCRIAEEDDARPDYDMRIGEHRIFVEIKELSGDVIPPPTLNKVTVWSSTLGQRLRNATKSASKQVQYGARLGHPSVCLVYNNFDYMQRIGTDNMDFQVAMYGNITVKVNKFTMKSSNLYHGGKKSFTPNMNTSFGALGHLENFSGATSITLHENVFGKPPIPFDALPDCFVSVRYSLD